MLLIDPRKCSKWEVEGKLILNHIHMHLYIPYEAGLIQYSEVKVCVYLWHQVLLLPKIFRQLSKDACCPTVVKIIAHFCILLPCSRSKPKVASAVVCINIVQSIRWRGIWVLEAGYRLREYQLLS